MLLASFVVAAAATVAHAQAPQGQGIVEMKASGVPGKATAKREATVTATVKAVDVAARTVTLLRGGRRHQSVKTGQ
jgi:translation elongation factor P/translation initiation factor 5A